MDNKLPYHPVLAILAVIAALGAMGVVSTISSVTEAEAVSCFQIIAGCHGCAPMSQGDIASESKCFNR